jgi:hypothetical protein
MRISGSRLCRSQATAWAGLGLSGLGLLLATSSPAEAASVSVQAFDIGNYCGYDQPDGIFYCDPSHDPSDTNTTTGYIDFSSADIDVAYRGFFAFDLNSQAIADALAANQQLTAATMRAKNFKVRCGVKNPTGSSCPPSFYGQTVSLYGVNGSITNLINGTSSFNNLGQGTAYAAVSFPAIPPEDGVTSFSLNPQGLAVVSSKLGQQLALSSRNNREVGQSSQSPIYVFGAPETPRSDLPVFLDLTFEAQGGGAAVPGPLPLLGAAAAWSWSRRLRRRCGEIRRSEADAGIEQGHQ